MEKNNTWAAACIHVLQKPLFAEDRELFSSLCNYRQEVSSYLAKIGLELVLNLDLGYAFIRQAETSDENELPLPKLIRRIPVTFEQSLVLVILYDELEKFDSNGGEDPFCIMTEEQVRELAQTCWPGASTDQTKFHDAIARALSDLAEQGLVRERRPQGMDDQESERYKTNRRFELRNIIRARVTKDFFLEFKRRLEECMGAAENQPSQGPMLVESSPDGQRTGGTDRHTIEAEPMDSDPLSDFVDEESETGATEAEHDE
ncbi:MAG: DUF4194 domain-containing protein [Sphaerochaetaceae bacterium]|jgi:hypothetical protein